MSIEYLIKKWKRVERTKHPIARDSRRIQPQIYALSSATSQVKENKKIEQGRDTLARRRIPNSWPSTKFHIFRLPGYAVDRRTIDRLLYDY